MVNVNPPNAVSVGNNDKTEFAFDHVLNQHITQVEMYEKSGKAVVECVLDGFNSTVLVYGQTNAGKTFTMSGTEENPGIIERFAKHLFASIASAPTTTEFSVQVSYVEIYLEHVRDLLEERRSQAAQMQKQNLQIRESAESGIHIPDATLIRVSTWQELLQVCETAKRNRATSETLMNQVSSRSHSVLLLTVGQRLEGGMSKTSKVSLVDLAGSEQIKRTGAEGDRLAEAQAINTSLSALGNVIHALTTSTATFIPYRDSKLTRLLQESLGGNAKTWLIINISPSRINSQETLSTLRFGQRAKSVKNNATVNAVKSSKELEAELKRAYERIAAQQEIIQSLRADQSNNGNAPITEQQQDNEEVIVLRHQMNELRVRLTQIIQERDLTQEGWEATRESLCNVASECEAKQMEIDRLKHELMRAGRGITEFRLEKLVKEHRELLRRCAALEAIVVAHHHHTEE